jgi:hypothetical protein
MGGTYGDRAAQLREELGIDATAEEFATLPASEEQAGVQRFTSALPDGPSRCRPRIWWRLLHTRSNRTLDQRAPAGFRSRLSRMLEDFRQ